MSDMLKWGVLSTARVKRHLLPAIGTARRSELVGVASRNPQKARECARSWEIPRAFSSYRALLASPEINVVYIPLPNNLHYEWVLKALRAGKHVLCEKPLGLSVAEVDGMKKAAGGNGLILMEGLAYRMHPQFAKLQELARKKTIGPVKLIRAHYSFTLPSGNGNIRWKKKLGGGCLWDLGCYPVSFSRAIAGVPPSEVFAYRENGTSGVEVFFAGQLIFPNGIIAQIDCGFSEPYRVGAEVVGQNGVICVPNPWQPDVEGRKSGLVHIFPDDHETVIVTEVVDPYLCEVKAMEDAVLAGRPPSYSLDESRDNIATLGALSRSAATGKAVKVGPRPGKRVSPDERRGL